MDQILPTDLPVPASISHYHDVFETAAQYIKKQAPRLTLYRQGGFSAPGISDIDLVLVYPDGDRKQAALAKRLDSPDVYGFDELGRRLFVHRIEVLSESQFRKLRYRYAFAEPVRLYGDSQIALDTSPAEDLLAGLIQSVEFLPMRYSNIINLLHGNELKIRNGLIIAHSICHSIEFVKHWGVTSKVWDTWQAEIKKIRSLASAGHYNGPVLRNLLIRGEVVCRELMTSFDDILNFYLPRGDSSGGMMFMHNRLRYTLYVPAIADVDHQELQKRWAKAYRLNFFPVLSLAPAGASRLLSLALCPHLPFSSRLRARCLGRVPELDIVNCNPEFVRIYEERAKCFYAGCTGPNLSDVTDDTIYRPAVKWRIHSMLRTLIHRALFLPGIKKARHSLMGSLAAL